MKIVNENERVALTRGISSNPLSDAFWYDESHLLKSEISVKTTYLIIEKAKCTDTKNFTLIASNALQRNVTSLVELIVNCKYHKWISFNNKGIYSAQIFRHDLAQVLFVVLF